MGARLPEVFGDTDNWGQILLDFLRVVHNDDGTLKNTVIGGFIPSQVAFPNGDGVLIGDVAFVFDRSTGTLTATIFNGQWGGATIGIEKGGTNAVNAVDARANLGLTIGTHVQAFHAMLASLVGLASGANKLAYFSDANAFSLTDLTAFARTLLDDADAAAGRATLAAAPASPSYVALGTNAELTNERVLTAGTNVTIDDAGAGGAVTINAKETGTWGADLGPSGTAARAIGNVYQNQSGKKRRVSINTYPNAGNSLAKLLVGSANPPTLPVQQAGDDAASSADIMPMYTEVPANHYYKLEQTSGTTVVVTWFEMDE